MQFRTGFFHEWREGGDGSREYNRGGLKCTTARTYEWKRLTKFLSKYVCVISCLIFPHNDYRLF